MRPPVVLPPRYAPDLEFLGRGGFGTVYRTRDLLRGHDVAVKVPHRDAGVQAAEVAAELQAVARLDHPGVVQVLDVGVDPSGQSWLAMEYADAGSLATYEPGDPMPWASLRPILDQLLDALGHAHARGLVHRDLKPDNVLLCRQGDDLVPKLADFGLAKIAQRDGGWRSTRLGAGTVLYMPPESFMQDTASIHPSADLYAFGVVTWVLTSDRRPFRSEDLSIVIEKLHEPLQPYRPRAGIPSGLGGLLERLLARRPEQRPALAADVRAELKRLDDRAAPTLSAADWASRAAVASQRVPRLRGRETELDRLRSAAAEVVSSGKARAVLLRGAPGVGRTRLSACLGEELEEAGRAVVLRIRLDDEASPDPALRRAVRRLLGLGQHTGVAVRDRIAGWAEVGAVPDDGTLADWLDPPEGPTQRAADAPVRRIAALDAVLRRQARRGLAILHLDALRPSAGLVELATALLGVARAEPYPLLLLLDPIGDDDIHRFDVLDVPPLDDGVIREILDELLDRSPVVPRLAARSGGCPARAVEAARLFVAQSHVEQPTVSRIPDETIDLADLTKPAVSATLDMDSVAQARLEGFMRDDDARRALFALVGLLPHPVPRTLLAAGFDAAGLADGLAMALADAAFAGLLQAEEGLVAFASDALAAAAAELAAPRALWSARAACLLLDARPDPLARLAAARLLADAGEQERAAAEATVAAREAADQDLDVALMAWEFAGSHLPVGAPERVALSLGHARACRDAGRVEDAEALLVALEADALPPAQRADLFELRGSLRVLRSDVQSGRDLAAAAHDLFVALGDEAGALRADLVRAAALLWCGERAAAGVRFAEVRAAAEAAGRPLEQLFATWRLAHVRMGEGDHAAARELYDEAATIARACGAVAHGAVVQRELGNLALMQGRFDDAEARLREALGQLHRTGRRAEIATTRISLGELARRRGQTSEARTEYTAALALTRSFGATGDAAAALVNLALLEIADGKPKAAARRLRAIDRLLEPGTAHWLRCHIEALRLAVAAAEARWGDAEEALGFLIDAEGELPADPDVLALLERAGGAAQAQCEEGLAAEVIDLAVQVAQRLGDRAAQSRLEGLLIG